jgi:hypothetical protein
MRSAQQHLIYRQVHVGRIDMEVAHCAILELKVGASVRPQDVTQLLKYVNARQAVGMRVRRAAVVCFCAAGHVEVVELQGAPSCFRMLKSEPSK